MSVRNYQNTDPRRKTSFDDEREQVSYTIPRRASRHAPNTAVPVPTPQPDADEMTRALDEIADDPDYYTDRHAAIVQRQYNRPTNQPPSARQTWDNEDGTRRLVIERRRPPNTDAGYQQALPSPRTHSRQRGWHPLLFLGLGVALTVFLVWAGISLNTAWTQHSLDATYGNPRTFQVDMVVGHHDSPANPTHFIAVNLNGQIFIIEMPGGQSKYSVIYDGPKITDANPGNAPATLSFQRNPSSGRLDMLLHIYGSSNPILYVNDGTRFIAST